MDELNQVCSVLRQEAIAARAYFTTWWTLRNLALPEFYATMNNHDFVDFFHVINTGTYNLMFLSISKIFDRDTRVVGVRRLIEELRAEGFSGLADEIESNISKKADLVTRIKRIRNQNIGHNQHLSAEKAKQADGVTPNEIRGVIDIVCESINSVSVELGHSHAIPDPQRFEEAVFNMLRQLRNGET